MVFSINMFFVKNLLKINILDFTQQPQNCSPLSLSLQKMAPIF